MVSNWQREDLPVNTSKPGLHYRSIRNKLWLDTLALLSPRLQAKYWRLMESYELLTGALVGGRLDPE
jgi:hypothetical protein